MLRLKPRNPSGDLDELVRTVDALGGPAAEAAQPVLHNFHYRPKTKVDQSLDPTSQAYLDQMLSVYREISGREINQTENEQTDFHLESHVQSAHPYAVRDPARLVIHYQRLAKTVRMANLPNDAEVLDFGSGWGLTTEFLAQLGCSVTAVDINPQFVDLVSRRAARLGHDTRAICGSFDDFEPDRAFDAVLFYECFHHAIAAWTTIARIKPWLKPGGRILLAGEPIQSLWWRHWGLRLDGLSLYCIRKFGWFESGWSRGFLTDVLARAGFVVDFHQDTDPDVGACICARLSPSPGA